MNRLTQAEVNVNELLEESKKLLSESNFLRLQNMGWAVTILIRWKKKVAYIKYLRQLAEQSKEEEERLMLLKLKEERNKRSRVPPKQKTGKGLTVDTLKYSTAKLSQLSSTGSPGKCKEDDAPFEGLLTKLSES